MPSTSGVSTSVARLRAQIAARLKARGQGQTAFAKSIGKSGTWISQILAGERGVPLDALDEIAEAFAISPGELLDSTKVDTWDSGSTHASTTSAATTRLLRRQQRIVERVLGLETTLDRIAAERVFLEFLDTTLRALVEDARAVHAAVQGQSDNPRDRSRLDRPRKARTGSRSVGSNVRR